MHLNMIKPWKTLRMTFRQYKDFVFLRVNNSSLYGAIHIVIGGIIRPLFDICSSFFLR